MPKDNRAERSGRGSTWTAAPDEQLSVEEAALLDPTTAEPKPTGLDDLSSIPSEELPRELKPAPTRKDRPTPRQRGEAREERTGPVTFVKESIAELRKVVYPTGQQLMNYWVVVLIFVLFVIGVVSLLDLAFGWLVFKIFA